MSDKLADGRSLRIPDIYCVSVRSWMDSDREIHILTTDTRLPATAARGKPRIEY
jgi:hypothetical protein